MREGNSNGSSRDAGGYAGLLIDRLASAIIDDSLPLKEVERDLRGSVADVAVRRRGLGKRETASRCGVTEKSIENYLKESRTNPKSPEREIARVLQDDLLTLEEIFEAVGPVLRPSRDFRLDDAKRALEKLIRTGEVREYPGHRYRAVERPSIRHPQNADGYRELVDQKARDLDYVVLSQKSVLDEELANRRERYARVVGDTNLVRIDFTVDVPPGDLADLYERLTEAIAKLTMKYEKKKGSSRVRLVLAMRSVATAVLVVLLVGSQLFRFDAPTAHALEGLGRLGRSWELDRSPPVNPVPGDAVPEAGLAEAPRPLRPGEVPILEVNLDRPGIVLPRVAPPEPGDPAPADGGDGEDANGADGDNAAPAAGDESEGGGGIVRVGDDEADGIDGHPLLRGDANIDQRIDVTDAVTIVRYVQGVELELRCLDAADVDDNGRIDLLDAAALVRGLYAGVDPLPLVYAPDATPDELDCEQAVGP